MKKDFLALIDSGATVSIFKAEVAEALGIDIETGKEIYLVSFNLLGRQEFFRRFRIIFEEKKNSVRLE